MRPIVLMSTFNGSLHVAQQIESILTQLPPDGRLVIRDDGSSDQTLQVALAASDARVTIRRGENVGFARSFLDLLVNAPEDADVYFLADQDDVWLPGKIERACDFLEPFQKQVALYCARATLTDASLRPLGLTPRHRPARRLRHALLQNIATGCTVAITKPLKQLVNRTPPAAPVGFHDWWLYVIATAFGTVRFDDHPSMLYRQHEGNVIGMGGGRSRYVKMLRFLRQKNWLQIANRQISAFRAAFDPLLTDAQRHELAALQTQDGRLNRIGILLSPELVANTLFADLLVRALVTMDPRTTANRD